MLFPYLKILLVFSFSTLICALTIAQSETDFNKGLDFFEAKKYQEAAAVFESIVEAGSYSKEIYFNLGNAYFQNQEPVKAILNYERALKLSPRFEEARFNLKIALEEIDNEVIEVPEFFLQKIWKNMHTTLRSNVWSIFFLISLWLSICAMIYWLLGKDRKRKKQAFIVGVSSLFLALLTFFLSSSQHSWETEKNSAIVMTNALKLKSAPEEENQPIMNLQAGTKLFFVDKIGSWNKVRLNNGQLGWLNGEEGLTRI